MKSELLSIYLPQFHTIPENDAWWGKGFTEWTNVRRGKSFYRGHYQPREPMNDEYYDLSDLRVLEKHTRMAKKAGIKGFCFYHYYFNGKTLLEKPIEQYRDQSKEDFPYCLIWANQSWTRTWYRANAGHLTLLQQTYGDESAWRRQFEYLLDFFKDNRYIKINNKPVYIMYLPQDINCRKSMFDLWNRLAKQNGFAGIYLVAMNTGWGKDERFKLYDAYMDFEPIHAICNDKTFRKKVDEWKKYNKDRLNTNKKSFSNMLWARNDYSYNFLCNRIENVKEKSPIQNYYGTFAGWDNTPRKDEDGFIVRNSTPRRLAQNIYRMLKMSEKAGNQYLFINAWNEWSEGAYIEPDKKYGYAYLRAIRWAVNKYNKE